MIFVLYNFPTYTHNQHLLTDSYIYAYVCMCVRTSMHCFYLFVYLLIYLLFNNLFIYLFIYYVLTTAFKLH